MTKGIAQALEINEPVQSPTFTISRVYDSPRGLSLAHYDFYRLGNAGIMSEEIREVAASNSVVVVEWAGAVDDALPSDRFGDKKLLRLAKKGGLWIFILAAKNLMNFWEK